MSASMVVDKNSINNTDDEKQENGAGSVGENRLDTTVKNNPMTAESQNFRLVDCDESQSTQISTTDNQQSKVEPSSSTPAINMNNADDKPDEAQGSTITKVVQDGGRVVEDESKVTIEAENSNNDIGTPASIVDEDEVIESTPSDQLLSPTNRQLLGATGPHKRKADDLNEPVAKIARAEEDLVIPETQESMESDDRALSEVINDSVKPEMKSESQKTITVTNENTVNDTSLGPAADDDVKSFQVLSQASENVLNTETRMEVEIDALVKKDGMQALSEPNEMVDKAESDEKNIDLSVKNSDETTKNVERSKDDDVTSAKANGTAKSRMSIEVIYEKSLAPPPRPKELVEIDEDGEKIVLDSSHEDGTLNDSDVNSAGKSIDSQQIARDFKESIENIDNKLLTNGNKHSKSKSDSDHTQQVLSELTTDFDQTSDSRTGIATTIQKGPEILSLISDSEEESFVTDEKPKIKTIPIEKEIAVLVKVKCLLHVDETSKDITSKEVIFSSCENAADLQLSRRRTSSALGLADISDGKDSVSPGSVISNPRTYPLNPRFSMMSVASSSSSSSSGSFKLPTKDAVQFSLPRGVPKHAKKALEPHSYDDILVEKLNKEWKNLNLLTTNLLNFLNSELLATDLHNGTAETTNNTSEHFRSSTPDISKANLPTPKTNEKVRLTKRTRSQSIRSSGSNGAMKQLEHSPKAVEKTQEVSDEKEENDSTNESLISAASTPSRQSARSLSILRNQTPVYDPSDALIGKQCYAKWGDNNYYPGIVASKSKTKLRINFLDGLSKLLMRDFVVVMPQRLPIGLSIYAAKKDDPYGSCGIITGVEESTDRVLYIVETDEGEKLKVGISDTFFTTDQVTILKEILNEDIKTPPSAPHLGKITLDNIVEGNRRNQSPVISTPKSARGKSRTNTGKKITDATPSGSGVPSKKIFEPNSDSDLKTSDSNASGADDDGLGSIQVEIIGTSSEYTTKGPRNRLKGKARSKKKVDDGEINALLGPIPDEGSTLFAGMNFILTCASLESLDKYKMDQKFDSNSESGTDFEQEWNSTPFIRERLTIQITAGGGKVYENFDDIPKAEYQITKLITNVPNITSKSLLCLSVGIPSWNHKWVIRSCLDKKVVNVNQEKLPAGWSLDRKSYIEMCDRPFDKPFRHIIIAVPETAGVEETTKLWKRIIENAGGTIRLITHPSDNFVEATAVLTNRQCPSWIEQRAHSENIPMVSTTWIVQCLIAGVIISHETQAAYFHRH